jgi:hypothetical protein
MAHASAYQCEGARLTRVLVLGSVALEDDAIRLEYLPDQIIAQEVISLLLVHLDPVHRLCNGRGGGGGMREKTKKKRERERERASEREIRSEG